MSELILPLRVPTHSHARARAHTLTLSAARQWDTQHTDFFGLLHTKRFAFEYFGSVFTPKQKRFTFGRVDLAGCCKITLMTVRHG